MTAIAPPAAYVAAGSGDGESVSALSPAFDVAGNDGSGGGGGGLGGYGGDGGGEASSDGEVAELRAPKEAMESGVGMAAPGAGLEEESRAAGPVGSPIHSSVSGAADGVDGDDGVGGSTDSAESTKGPEKAPEVAPISPSVAAGLTPMLHGEYADPGEDEIMVKTEFVWADGANHDVRLSGAWNGWMPVQMYHEGGGMWSVVTPVPAGTHEFKFVVDGEWRHSTRHPTVGEDESTMNNIRVIRGPPKVNGGKKGANSPGAGSHGSSPGGRSREEGKRRRRAACCTIS
ncbi:hypothetical protein MMPV_000373 [Pyropia vietnamensis]